MSRTEIIEKLKDVFELVNETAGDFTEQSRLIEDIGLSSVGILYLVVAIEEFFNIRFDDVGFGDFTTVSDVIDYIEGKLR